jgi:1-aminocyclopropane-1-carboxylate deaminase/D-cysteine desulfhydrase-like pyridoxal-dependent ACC family enzyme
MLYHFSCTAVIKAKEGMSTAMLNDTRRWNANIIYAPANYDDDDKWAALAAEKNLLFIPMGGDGKLAAAGVCHFLRQSSIPLYNHVFCPVGTGTTLRGIAASGIAANRLTGINPGIKDGFKIFLAETQKTCSASIDIIKNDSLKKFGQWPLFLPGMMNDWYRHWDLPTDVVYTAKMVFIFLEMIKKETIEAGSTCLLVHTGGLQGNRSLVPGLLIF